MSERRLREVSDWLAAPRQIWRSELGRTLLFAVFASTVLIELVILVPSVIGFRKDQIARVVDGESERVEALFQLMPAQTAVGHAAHGPYLVGLEARDATGAVIASWGSTDESNPGTSADLVTVQRMLTASTGAPLGLRLRFDISHVSGLVHAYVLRIVGLVLLIVLFVVAVTAAVLRKKVLLPLEHQALHDVLTGLPNRNYFDRELRATIDASQRNGKAAALLFIDLDRFKDFNDNFGHPQGDALLVEVARRLRSIPGIAARLGGDEFGLILPQALDAGAVRCAAAEVLTVLSTPYAYNQFHFQLSASIGMVLLPEHGSDSVSAQCNADIAMYAAKHAGRGRCLLFDAAMSQAVVRRKQLQDWLQDALDRDEFKLHYQPKIRLADECIVGAEALLRWVHPQHGPISPAEFIPVAEESGLIVPLGLWVLRDALRQLDRWQQQGFDLPKLSINVSANQFNDENFLRSFLELLDHGEHPLSRLDLEITEGTLLADPVAATQALTTLLERGITVSLDDFGTGYSSLSYLKRLPVASIKIDRSFVMDLAEDEENASLLKAIISLGHSLGMRLVAEGVETFEQHQLLKGWGCDEYQGFLASPALAATDFERFYQGWQTKNTVLMPSLPSSSRRPE